jgi:hypothetical protein
VKKTPWFSAAFRPTREGWYETTCAAGFWGTPGRPDRAYWSGKAWCIDEELDECSFGIANCDRWRGLTEPAK